MVDDKTLILEFLDGNVESFNTLILQHEGWVHGMILQVVRHKEDTEDLKGCCIDIDMNVWCLFDFFIVFLSLKLHLFLTFEFNAY